MQLSRKESQEINKNMNNQTIQLKLQRNGLNHLIFNGKELILKYEVALK
tara:strand:- start:338 stop:484 length:147 start_codon:yes stop_codon:yes gene_type:complete